MRGIILLVTVVLLSVLTGYTEPEKTVFKVDNEMLDNFKTLHDDARRNYLGGISRGIDRDKYIVDKQKLSAELIPLLKSNDTNELMKSGVAYLMGIFQLEDCIDVLIDNLMLYNPEALRPDMAVEGDWPARVALEMIGKPAIPAVIRKLEISQDSVARGNCQGVILGVCGQKGGRTVLLDALNKQADPEKRSRLQEALKTENFDERWKSENTAASPQTTNQPAVGVSQIQEAGKTNDL